MKQKKRDEEIPSTDKLSVRKTGVRRLSPQLKKLLAADNSSKTTPNTVDGKKESQK